MPRLEQVGALAGAVFFASALIYGYASGPDPRYTGAPGDSDQACASLGCHTGTALNGGGGNVVVNFANGHTYAPGVQQTFNIVITDSAARVYGFQMTARLESNLAGGQAGDRVGAVGSQERPSAGLRSAIRRTAASGRSAEAAASGHRPAVSTRARDPRPDG